MDIIKIELNNYAILQLIKWLCVANDFKIINDRIQGNDIVLEISNNTKTITVNINHPGEIHIKNNNEEENGESGDNFKEVFERMLFEFIENEDYIKLLEFCNIKNSIVFIDLNNVFHWQEKFGWRFHPKKLIKFLSKIDNVSEVRVYYGEKDINDDGGKSKSLLRMLRQAGANVRTKEVKYINKSLEKDGAGIFLRQQRLDLFSDEATMKVESLVAQLIDDGHIIWKEPKCNFDVEITLDMVDSVERAENIILFSGDCDFDELVKRIRLKGRKIIICCTSGCLSEELRINNDNYFSFKIFRKIIEWI